MRDSTVRPQRNSAANTTAQLRDDIDRGRTGDKVNWPDPAAAPLGTDDEAAGHPMDSRGAAHARSIETAGETAAPQRNDRIGAAWVMIIVVALAAGAILAAWAILAT